MVHLSTIERIRYPMKKHKQVREYSVYDPNVSECRERTDNPNKRNALAKVTALRVGTAQL